MRQGGHTLVEAVTVVLILGALASVAVIRMHPDLLPGVRADAAVRQMATDLRRTRSEALLHAARNPAGFALVMEGRPPWRHYRIIDLSESTTVDRGEIAREVRCVGGQRFAFGPLGNLTEDSDLELHLSTDGRDYALEIVPATGAVTWTRRDQ